VTAFRSPVDSFICIFYDIISFTFIWQKVILLSRVNHLVVMSSVGAKFSRF